MELGSQFAAKAYGAAKQATQASPKNVEGQLGGAAEDFAKVLVEGEQTAKSVMNGGADAHALVEALAQTQLAVETAVTVRDKVVEAYQEILRMPV